MSHVHSSSFQFNISPTPAPGTQVQLQQTPQNLFNVGYNMLVEISTASAFLKPGSKITRSVIPVWAHFDTGARVTTLDDSLAKHLGLISTGQSQIRTANGNAMTNNYAANISFVGNMLNSIQNLMVSSCNLGGFSLQKAIADKKDATNFGVLIGRDIMSLWNITWHGPTSTVLISD